MNRRGVLATLGVALSGGCLDTTRSPSDSPTEFDRPAYAEGFRPHGPWEANRYDSAGSGHNPESRLPTGDVDGAWCRSLDGSIDPRAVPVTDDRHLYVGHQRPTDDGPQGVVTALEGETGTQEWTTVLEIPTGGDGDTSAADTSGRPRARTWDTVGGLTRDGDTIYVTGHSRQYEVVLLAALERDGGTVDWQVSVPGTEYRAPVTDANGVSLAFGRETSSDGEPPVNALYAFSHGGSERWHHRFGTAIPAGNACADGVVYTRLDDGRIVALESDGGTVRWERTLETGETTRDGRDDHLAVDGDRLYVSVGGRLSALSREDGSVLWSLDSEASVRPLGPLVRREGTIYVGAGNVLVAIDSADGTERWRLEDAPVHGSLVGVADGLVGASGTTVTGFDLDGERRWSLDLREDSTGDTIDELDSRILSAHDLVYVPFTDGYVSALGAPTS
ncbi:PQQ-binding-like beta-propeller repeat protein [Halobacteria archaeon AArc-m2/3/4]|uniref:PQQ-binding-like beta-propeller repeat protein n=1 Tax=Natronoglomus mannanivorans TaxID=2979990 RepID=A0ABT2QAR9_9EURY|nr:PQQ-binding-like beta-propeller repeat protein [Halobacteria archaeon AArc-m2/3/4]